MSTIETATGQAHANFDRTMSGLKDGMATAAAGFGQAQDTVHQGMHKAMQGAEEMLAFGQGNADALTQSGQVLATGLHDMSQAFAAAARASMNETVGTYKAMAGARSIKELMDLQAALFRSSLDRAVAHTTQITDSSIKLAEQVIAPVGARLSLAAEKFGRPG